VTLGTVVSTRLMNAGPGLVLTEFAAATARPPNAAIPNTVAAAVRSVLRIGGSFVVRGVGYLHTMNVMWRAPKLDIGTRTRIRHYQRYLERAQELFSW
jgi:hypothetical protein